MRSSLHRLSIALALVWSAWAWVATVSAAEFDLVATHPDAAAQSTAVGQMISTLKPFNGKLYAGYGDYDPQNTGPIGIRAFDPALGAFTDNLLTRPQPPHGAETNAVLMFREIGGKLYAPHIDPWPDPPPAGEMGGFSVGLADGATETWTDHRVVQGIHMFDLATFDGTDLWLVGSNGPNAVVWRKRNAASDWEVSLTVPPQRTGIGARFYAIHAYNGKLYTQGQELDPSWGPHATSKVFDGTSWSDGPSLGGGYIGNMWHPETFAGEMVFDRLRGGAAGRMGKFNGTRTALAYPDANVTFYDYTIDGSVLYALASDGRIVYTRDLNTWSPLVNAPAGGRSLGTLDGALYVGATGGQLFRYSLTNPTLPQWSVDADGNWSTAANWSGAVPGSAGAVARFGSAIRAQRRISVDVPTVIGSIVLDNDVGYEIGGPSGLTLDASGGNVAEIRAVRAGDHVIAAPLTLADDTIVTVSDGDATVALSALVPTAHRITKRGAGTLEVKQLRAAALDVEAGTVRIAPRDGAEAGMNVLEALTLAGSTGAWTATIDLGNGGLVLGGANGMADLARVIDQVKHGRDRGTSGRWSGAGITSSTAASNPLTGLALVYMWGSGNIVLRHTYNGDANLDGRVNADDYFRIDSGFLAPPLDPLYADGDFNYDGRINADDYFLIDSAFLGQGAPLASSVSWVTVIPEPGACATMLLLGLAMLHGRARGRCVPHRIA